jgi:hypothetical protein
MPDSIMSLFNGSNGFFGFGAFLLFGLFGFGVGTKGSSILLSDSI